jgi:predicted nucleotidyltransferase
MYESILLGLMRKMQPNDFSTLPYVSEGLENRLKSASDISGSIDEFIDNVCTKRYTRTRIQRILLSLLTGMTSNEFDNFNKYGGPQYIRVLGFNNKGRELLSKIKKSAVLPIIVKTANFKYSCNPLLKRMLQIEAAATDIYVLGYGNTNFRKAGQEYTQNLIRL